MSLKPATFTLKSTMIVAGALACLAFLHAESSLPVIDNSRIIAVVDGVEIRQSEVDLHVGQEAHELELKLYALRRHALEDLIDNILASREAERRGQTPRDLLDTVAGPMRVPAHLAIEQEYAENKNALKDLGKLTAEYRIALELEANRRTEAVRSYVAELHRKSSIRILLRPPAYELPLHATLCRLGSADAKDQLTVFLDYECPFCKKIEPVLYSLSQNPDLRSRLQIVIKQLPLPIHQNAENAAKASVCAANVRDKFPKFHFALLQSSDHSSQGLVDIARKTGLDLPAFSKCVSGNATADLIHTDMEDAQALGVDSTPTLFLNGGKLQFSDDGDLQQQILERLDTTEPTAIRQARNK